MSNETAEVVQRPRDKKKRRLDLQSAKNSLEFTKHIINDDSCCDISKCVLTRMMELDMIDDYTDHAVIQCINKHASDMLEYSIHCDDGNGFELLKACIDPDQFPTVMDVLKANYSSLSGAEQKCMYWTLCGAFMIMIFEVHSDLIFQIPFSYEEKDFERFLRRYPEFLVRTWDASELFQFQLCMKCAVQCFGNGNNMGCLVELVTGIMKGREVALTCNTSGGGLRNYDNPTEVSTEKCRILIYQRESGIVPRTRRSRGMKRKLENSAPVPSSMLSAPGSDAARFRGELSPPMGIYPTTERLQYGHYFPQHFVNMSNMDQYSVHQANLYSRSLAQGGHYYMPPGEYNFPGSLRQHEVLGSGTNTYGDYGRRAYEGLPIYDQRQAFSGRYNETAVMNSYVQHGDLYMKTNNPQFANGYDASFMFPNAQRMSRELLGYRYLVHPEARSDNRA